MLKWWIGSLGNSSQGILVKVHLYLSLEMNVFEDHKLLYSLEKKLRLKWEGNIPRWNVKNACMFYFPFHYILFYIILYLPQFKHSIT